MSIDPAAPRSRRNILAAALGAVGATVATTLGRPISAEAASGDPLYAGATNSASSPTVLDVGGHSMTAALMVDTSLARGTAAVLGMGTPAVAGRAASDGPGNVGVLGIGYNAVVGAMSGDLGTSGEPAGVYGVGLPNAGSGVVGQGFWDPGVVGKGTETIGVMGSSDSSSVPAIHGWSLYKTGVSGYVGAQPISGWGGGPDGVRGVDGTPANAGRGVYGYSSAGTGVVAEAGSTGVGLRVIGKAAFSRSGRLAITSGHSSISKTLAGVTSSSLVIAVLQTHRTGVYVAAAAPTTGKFTVYLNKTVTATTYVAYFIIN